VLITNVAAWTDYTSGSHPLVHLWSIAVEEQFYVAYPLLLLAVLRAGKVPSLLLVGTLTGASFALCVWASYSAPTANLFLAPTRGWELLLGALLVLGDAPVRAKVICELLSVLSLVTIAMCVHFYSPQMRYPGVSSVLPSLAACGLLVSARDRRTTASRLLSLRPVVFTGLISYSLYLWHVPIFTFLWHRSGSPPTAMGIVVALVASFLTAVASWLLVEQPLRRKKWLNSNRRFLTVAALTNAILGVIGLVLWLHGNASASRIAVPSTMMSHAAHY
jgi:peptidoglycan/LPS O-acetylase OafA/YrhL